MSRSRIIAGKAVIVIEAVDHVNRTLDSIRSKLHRSANALNQAGGAMARTGFFGSIASGLMLRQFAKFDDAMLALRVKLGYVNKLTAEQDRTMKGLEATIRQLGKTTSYTSQEIANSAVTLAQGGLNPAEIKNSLRAVLDLARGTQASLDDAGRMFIRTMRTFNIESRQAGEVVSQFVRATRFGTLNIEDLEQALRYSAGTAATLDQNLSPMLAIFAELSNKGLAGSIGGTSMNTAMANMIKKLEDIQGLIPGFQLVRNQNGLDMLATFKELFNFTKTLPSTEQVKIFQDLFNLRGSRAVAGIRDIDNVIRMADEIANAGDEARKASEIMDSGMGGRGRIALSALQDAILALGKASEKYVIPALNIIKNLINELNRLIQQNPDLAAAIVLSPPAILASGLAFIALGKAIRLTAIAMGGLQGVAKPVMRLLGAGAAGQIGALTTGIAGRKGGKRTGRTGGLLQMLFGVQQFSKKGSAKGRKGGLLSGFGITGIHSKLVKMRGPMYQIIKLGTSLSFVLMNILSPVTGVGFKSNLTFRAIMSIKSAIKNLYRSAQTFASSGGLYQMLMGASGKVGSFMKNPLGKSGKALSGTSIYYRNVMQNLAGGRLAAAIDPKKFKAMAGMYKGTGLAKTGSGIIKLASGLFRAANAARRFLFSFTGVLTILEAVFIFTDLGSRMLNGFKNALTALGRTLVFIQGPWQLFKAGMEAIASGNTQMGINAIKLALSSLGEIIKNQVVAAWERFKASLGDKGSVIGSVVNLVKTVVMSAVDAIELSLQLFAKSIKATFGTFGGLFGGSDTFSAENIAKFVTELSVLLNKVIGAIPRLLNELSHVFDSFLIKFEGMIRAVIPSSWLKAEGTGTFDRGSYNIATPKLNQARDAATDPLERLAIELQINKVLEERANKELKRLNEIDQTKLSLAEKQRLIDYKRDTFATLSISRMNQRTAKLRMGALKTPADATAKAEAAAGRSAGIANATGAAANVIRESIRSGTKQAIEQVAQGPPARRGAGIPNMMNNLEQAKQVTRIAAAALVGSAAATRGNLLRVNDSLEKQQLEALQDIRDDQRKGLKDRGVILQ